MSARIVLATLAALAPLAAAAPSAAGAGDPDGLLPSLPAHARPGVCYARVTAAATVSPPVPGRVRWRLSPPPPGAPGPLWCLVEEPGQPARVIAPERSGWIRVLCDDEATPARISRVQRRLHELRVYEGEASGRYDAATAAAVGRFQSERRIAHGGYLSLRTLDALEGGAAYAALPPPPVAAPPCCVAPPPPPPVVTIPVVQPPPPPSPWLSWPGKRVF